MPCVLAIDPGFARFGYAIAEIDEAGVMLYSRGPGPAVGVLKPVKGEGASVAEADALTIQSLYSAIVGRVREYLPDVLVVESFVAGRSHRALRTQAAVAGALSALAWEHDLALCWYSPAAVKAGVNVRPKYKRGGRSAAERAALKQQVIDAVQERHPELRPLFTRLGARAEHAADAVALLHAFAAQQRKAAA